MTDVAAAWSKLLPQLVVYLEENRKERLERERTGRRQERHQELREFWNTTKKLLPPLLQAAPLQEGIEAISPPLTVVKDNILYQPFPSFSRMQEWSEYTQLLEEDIPGAELKLKLEDKRDSLNEFVRKWKTQLEERMIQQLPDHIELPNFNAPGLSLTSNTQPGDSLFAGTQMLLRGDVTFKTSEYDYCKFYPEDFEDLYDMSRISYDINSSAIAADLLRTLERSGATYLEMKSLGRVFQCGKCDVCELMSWKGLIKHYTVQKSEWKTLSNYMGNPLAKEFTYIFTHDTNVVVENSNKPLARIVEGKGSLAHSVYGPKKLCLICRAVEAYRYLPDTCINDHMRDVHLIEEPEQGKHFR